MYASAITLEIPFNELRDNGCETGPGDVIEQSLEWEEIKIWHILRVIASFS